MKLNLVVLLFLAVSVLFSCKEKEVISHNEKLLSVHSIYVYEADTIPTLDRKFIAAIDTENLHKTIDTVSYLNGKIYVSCLRLVSGCTDYTGDIQFDDDTIKLFTVNPTGITCTEQDICRLSYLIRNPGNKHYIIKKE